MSDHGSAKKVSARLLAGLAVVVEVAAAAVIAVVAILAVLAAVRVVPAAGRELLNATGRTAELELMISDLLLTFIAIELMRIALAYIRGVNVLPTVIEAGLVAVIRQVVLFHPKENVLAQASALAILAISLGLVSYLLSKSVVTTAQGMAEFLGTDEERGSAAAEGAPASVPVEPATASEGTAPSVAAPAGTDP